jgi:hypothetical protein
MHFHADRILDILLRNKTLLVPRVTDPITLASCTHEYIFTSLSQQLFQTETTSATYPREPFIHEIADLLNTWVNGSKFPFTFQKFDPLEEDTNYYQSYVLLESNLTTNM